MERVRSRTLSRGGRLRTAGRLALLALVAGCAGGEERVLTVRTSLPEEATESVERSFQEAHPEVELRIVRGDDAEALREARDGQTPPPFDVWWAAPAGLLEAAGREGLLAPIRPGSESAGEGSLGSESVGRESPGTGASGEDSPVWTPLLVSPWVIAFNREELTLSRAPRDWLDLFHFRWVGELVAPDPTTTASAADFIRAVVAEGVRTEGDELVALDWLRRLDGQVAGYVEDESEAIRALRAGDVQLAVVRRTEVDRAVAEGAEWLAYRIPESGTPVSILGVGMVRGTSVPGLARAFVEHAGSPEAVDAVASATGWESAAADPRREWIGYPAPVLPPDGGAEWLRRWREEVRGTGR